MSDEWCTDCWLREHEGVAVEQKGERVWDDYWPGGVRWSGYGGERGKDVWRDDVPQ
jgi:hypothetical protein